MLKIVKDLIPSGVDSKIPEIRPVPKRKRRLVVLDWIDPTSANTPPGRPPDAQEPTKGG